VDAIFDHADPDRFATALMQRVQDGDPNVADALLKLLDGVPTDTVMAAQQEMSGDENAPATLHEVQTLKRHASQRSAPEEAVQMFVRRHSGSGIQSCGCPSPEQQQHHWNCVRVPPGTSSSLQWMIR
jgi:hypothetical protein